MTDPRILAYLRQYGRLYTQSSLRNRLLGAGYSHEEIDAAVAELTAESGTGLETQGLDLFDESAQPPAPPGNPQPGAWYRSRRPAGRRVDPVIAAGVFMAYIAAVLLGGFIDPNITWGVVVATFLVWAFATATNSRSLASGLGWGLVVFPVLLIVVGLLFLLLIWGYCLAGGKITFG
jgi:hypothetical protein